MTTTHSPSILKPVCDKASEVVNVIVVLDVHVLVDVHGFEKPYPKNKKLPTCYTKESTLHETMSANKILRTRL
jgi:hypothetical protein